MKISKQVQRHKGVDYDRTCIELGRPENFEYLHEWCYTMFGIPGHRWRWAYRPNRGSYNVSFTDESDASVFLLRWS